MTARRMAALVVLWARFYTRNLPAPIARRRIGEIAADLHDHLAHERDRGTGDRRIALGIAGRMLRGIAADASWRRHALAHHSGPKDVTPMSRTVRRSALRVASVTAAVLLVPFVSMQIGDETNWSAADFVFAGVLLAGTGALLELAARRPRNVAYRAAAIAIAVGAIVLGEADDAPGLVLFGLLVIAGTVAMAVRVRLRARS